MPFPGGSLLACHSRDPDSKDAPPTSQHRSELVFKSEAMWPLSTVVLVVGWYRAGHSQLNESGAALATISEMPGHANRETRSGNANSIK